MVSSTIGNHDDVSWTYEYATIERIDEVLYGEGTIVGGCHVGN